jgi:uroporphyrinogen decarboxylase
MTPRERVLRALCFQTTDRVPRDLGGMASTGISCFAYPKLVAALGLPPRLPRVHDTSQMLALPDPDVLDALGCDVVTTFWGVTNALEEPEKWQAFDFGGRLPARVRDPSQFTVHSDGTVEQPRWKTRMPPSAYVFESDGAGQSIDYISTGDLGLKNLAALREELRAALPTPAAIREARDDCRRVRASTERAVFYNGPGHSEIAISGHGGIGVFPVICLLHPDYAAEYHEIMTAQTIAKLEMVLPEIRDSVDVILLGGDDWGSQLTTFAPPEVFRTLFLPYYRRMNEAAHRLAPGVKTFIHTCGAVFDVIDLIIESGFDILNPVQWTAGGRGFRAWKEKCRERIALWGGGVDTQRTLPLGTVADVAREVREVVECLSGGSGYVFNSIHNILAEIEPEKIIALYRAAAGRAAAGTPAG